MSSRKNTKKVVESEEEEEEEEEDEDIEEEEDEEEEEESEDEEEEEDESEEPPKKSVPMKTVGKPAPAAAAAKKPVAAQQPQQARAAVPAASKTVAKPAAAPAAKPTPTPTPAPAAAAAAKPAAAAPAAKPSTPEENYRFMRFFAECVGTFAIAFVVTATNAQLASFDANGTTSLEASNQGFLSFVEVVLAQVFVYAAMHSIFRSVSHGHFNPAVTFGYMCLFEISWLVGVAYIMFQLIGAILGALLAWGVFYQDVIGAPIMDPYNLCAADAVDCPFILGDGRGFLIELIGSSAVVLVSYFVDLAHAGGDSGSLVVSFVYGAFFFALKIFSNAFFNPAVALGAAVAATNYNWADNRFWYYIIAPLISSIGTALIYGFCFQIAGHGTGPHLQFWSAKNQRPSVL